MTNDLKKILKKLGLQERFLLQLSDDTDARGTVIKRWAYNDPDSPGDIEFYADGWIDIVISGIVLYDGMIDEYLEPCLFCDDKQSATHFLCQSCGTGMCDDCYNADVEHDGIYHMVFESCENELIEKEIINLCGYEPDYLCEDCYNLAVSRAIATTK